MSPLPPPPPPPPTQARDYVIDDIDLPKDQNQASQLGFDFDGDGLPDNALGGVLSGLAGVLQGIDINNAARLTAASGDNLLLIRIAARNYSNDSTARGSFWRGARQICCKNRSNYLACRSEGKATCFSGNFVHTSTPPQGALSGAISGGSFTLTSPTIPMRLDLGAGSINFSLRAARISGRIAANELSSVRITGGISRGDMQSSIVPAFARLIDSLVQNPNTPQTTRDQVLNLFDANKDGRVSSAEVGNNSLIQTFLSGDVDVDRDGLLELSLGFGASAVRAQIR